MNTASPIPLLILIVLAAAWVTWLIVQPRMTGWRRERLRRNPFPQDWERIMRRRVPLVRRMPEDLQTQLKGHIQVFLAEKAFIGCEGQAITDEVRITVAAQACLLLLNRPTDYYPPPAPNFGLPACVLGGEHPPRRARRGTRPA